VCGANPDYRGQFQYGQPQDLASGETPALFQDRLVVPLLRFFTG
jgi:hypothetical protein